MIKRLSLFLSILTCSCHIADEYNQKPEIESLRQGLKTSAAIGYCVSVVNAVVKGYTLPSNMVYDSNLGLIYINVDQSHPLPFNSNVGDIAIAFSHNTSGGIMAISFANIDILGGSIKLYGLNLVPFIERPEENDILAMFFKQDVILGYGSDTILDLSRIDNLLFNSRIEELNNEQPSDVFVAVKQNVWFLSVKQNLTPTNFYDDLLTINGGGQIAEVKGSSGGIIYHAMINTEVNYSECTLNPIDGYALSQNFKVGGEPYIDMGNSLLSFRNTCDGKAYVELSTGKYIGYNGKNISLNLQ